jgi:hypothetical protein
MGYPTKSTIDAFKQIVEKDGMEDILENLVNAANNNKKIAPIVGFLKEMVHTIISDNLEDELSAYTNGFISCLDLFRRQLESETIDLEDLNLQLDNIVGWNEFLEKENFALKEEIDGLKRRNKELQEMSTLPTNGNDTSTI